MARKSGNSSGQSPQRDNERCERLLSSMIRQILTGEGVASEHPLVVRWFADQEARALAKRIGGEIEAVRPGEKIPFPSGSLPPIF